MSEIFDSARAAWDYLVLHGGMEVHGRDAALVEQLAERLALGTFSESPEDAPKPVLDDVLKKVSIEQFVNALFGVVRPFIGMMRDLLDYFTKAGVTEGPGHWKLALTSETESLEVDLDHFKNFLKVAETRLLPLEVPVLNRQQRWDVSSKAFSDASDFPRPIGMRPSTRETDSGAWLSIRESTGEPPPWLPLPPVVYRMLERNDSLKDAAAVLYEFASVVQSYVPNYATLSRELSSLRRNAADHIRESFEIEHDRWIETMVANLAAFEVAPAHEQSHIILKLTGLFEGLSRKPAEFAISFDDLRAFLDLPIWKRRYELYSAWILTQFLTAMRGHRIELHSEKGKLTFGFHATKLATVRSFSQPVTIYGERRVVATDLKGHGRKAGIQPDYTVWIDDINLCKMAIECKHYKRPSYSNFSEALDDYARNLPAARVVLGNYGPIPLLLKLDTKNGGRSGRQFAFGNLNPDHPEEVEGFRKTIQSVFGDPLPSRESEKKLQVTRILAFDVSPSMRDILRNKDLQKEVEEIVSELGITHFAAVDNRLLILERADMKRIDWLVDQSKASNTALKSASEELGQTASELYFLTDAEGAGSLGTSAENMWRYTGRFEQLRKLGAILASVNQ